MAIYTRDTLTLTCTYRTSYQTAWWMVDLLEPMQITRLEIYNRIQCMYILYVWKYTTEYNVCTYYTSRNIQQNTVYVQITRLEIYNRIQCMCSVPLVI